MLRIKELRIEKGLTQKELAAKIDSTDKNIWAYENKVAVPPLDILTKMADVFNCSIDYLSGRSDDFGVINVYHQTDNVAALSADEQRLIDVLRKNPPHNATDWLGLYSELPLYMQEKIFAELKGMHLGYKAAQATAKKKN